MATEAIPRANEGLYRTLTPNAEVPIWSGRLRIAAGASVAGRGRVLMPWLPTPALRFELEGSPSGDLQTEGTVSLWGQKARGRCLITSRPLFPAMPGKIEGIVNGPLAIGGTPQMARLVVHVINFPKFLGRPIEVGKRSWLRGRASLAGNGWKFTIDACPHVGQLVDGLNATGGYAITHVGVLEREDGALFRPRQAADPLDRIGNLLSFASGAWAIPQLYVGVAADGRQVFRECGARPVGRWGGHSRWFNDLDVESLERAFVGFDRLWAKGVWREPLKLLIYLYVNANAGPPDIGLVLAQAALEQMAWHLLVNDRKVVSADGFGKLPAADQLRLLVSSCGIPLDTPSSLQDLAAMRTQGRQVTDGPDRIARLRNDFVHPPSGGSSARTHGRIVDAWRLSLWYLELALLSLMGQSGTYRSRLNSGEVSSLPWS
ncbi:MAG: hypothetical protein ABSA21_11635 [Candidatus Limnocylindrales bacterium]|jgi:hypothetical protein